MKTLLLALALTALTGCAASRQFVDEHPRAVAIGGGILLTSALITARSHSHGGGGDVFAVSTPLTAPPDVTTQPVTCTGSCAR